MYLIRMAVIERFPGSTPYSGTKRSPEAVGHLCPKALVEEAQSRDLQILSDFCQSLQKSGKHKKRNRSSTSAVAIIPTHPPLHKTPATNFQ